MKLTMALVGSTNPKKITATVDADGRAKLLQMFQDHWSTEADDTPLIFLSDAVADGQGNYTITIPANRADEFADLVTEYPPFSGAHDFLTNSRAQWTPGAPTELEPE